MNRIGFSIGFGQNATDLEIDALRQIHSLLNPEDNPHTLGRLRQTLSPDDGAS
jgi:hypothetical protein